MNQPPVNNFMPLPTEEADAVKQFQRAKNGRTVLMLIFVLSLINIISFIIGFDLYFSMSLLIPTFLTVYFGTPGMIIGIGVISLFLLFFFFAKNSVWPFIAGVVVIALDTLVLAYFVFMNLAGIYSFIFDILYHVLALILLGNALSAALKIRRKSSVMY